MSGRRAAKDNIRNFPADFTNHEVVDICTKYGADLKDRRISLHNLEAMDADLK